MQTQIGGVRISRSLLRNQSEPANSLLASREIYLLSGNMCPSHEPIPRVLKGELSGGGGGLEE